MNHSTIVYLESYVGRQNSIWSGFYFSLAMFLTLPIGELIGKRGENKKAEIGYKNSITWSRVHY